jgi:phage terminase Nu1 subunit (DNA packaging protein)
MNNGNFLSPEQVSKLLGISVYTISKLAKNDVLPHGEGKRELLVFDATALSTWLSSKEKEACHA